MLKPKKQTPKRSKNPSSIDVVHTEFYSGPIPTASMFDDYNRVDPTFANRILIMSEAQQKHIQAQENRKNILGFILSTLGILCAVVVVGGLLYALYFALESGMEKAAIWIVCSMASVGGIFIWRSKK